MKTEISHPKLKSSLFCVSSPRFPRARVTDKNILQPDWRPGQKRNKAPSQQRRDAFTELQKEKLLVLRDALLETMSWTARDTQVQTGAAPVYATHNGDAGSDACDRDLAFCLLTQEVDSLFEIDQALERIEEGRYGICEMSGKPIPRTRLEAIPFARFTVECQSELERRDKRTVRQQAQVSSLIRNGAEANPSLESILE